MESPETWDLITASLAVSDLSKRNAAWAFLVVQKLVRDSDDDQSAFKDVVDDERSRGPITGPSVAARVASRLAKLGITLPAACAADPNADVAGERRDVLDSWIVTERGNT